MSNLILLCHGKVREFGSFDLGRSQEVQYRGQFGTYLSQNVAIELVRALLSDPTVSEQEIARTIMGYEQHETLVGPGSFGPNIDLSGDNGLLCMLLNMNTRKFCLLGSRWATTLDKFVQQAGNQAFWLNLLCCTKLDVNKAELFTSKDTAARSWQEVLSGRG